MLANLITFANFTNLLTTHELLSSLLTELLTSQ